MRIAVKLASITNSTAVALPVYGLTIVHISSVASSNATLALLVRCSSSRTSTSFNSSWSGSSSCVGVCSVIGWMAIAVLPWPGRPHSRYVKMWGTLWPRLTAARQDRPVREPANHGGLVPGHQQFGSDREHVRDSHGVAPSTTQHHSTPVPSFHKASGGTRCELRSSTSPWSSPWRCRGPAVETPGRPRGRHLRRRCREPNVRRSFSATSRAPRCRGSVRKRGRAITGTGTAPNRRVTRSAAQPASATSGVASDAFARSALHDGDDASAGRVAMERHAAGVGPCVSGLAPPRGSLIQCGAVGHGAHQVDVGIITILADEFEAVHRRLSTKTKIVSGRREYNVFSVPTVNGACTVALTRCLEQGTGEAQSVARDLLEELDPQWLLVVGIAGSVPVSELTLGDVVVSTRILDFSVEAVAADHS